MNDLREVARGIFPPLLSDEGLAAALGALARRAGPETQLSILGRVDRRPLRRGGGGGDLLLLRPGAPERRSGMPRGVGWTSHSPTGRARCRSPSATVGTASRSSARKPARACGSCRTGWPRSAARLTIESVPGAGTTVTGTLPAHVLEPADVSRRTVRAIAVSIWVLSLLAIVISIPIGIAASNRLEPGQIVVVGDRSTPRMAEVIDDLEREREDGATFTGGGFKRGSRCSCSCSSWSGSASGS